MASQTWGPSHDAEGSNEGGQTYVPPVDEGTSNDGGRPKGSTSDEKDRTTDICSRVRAGVGEESTMGDRPGGPASIAKR